MFDATAVDLSSDKRRYVKVVQRELRRHGWRTMTDTVPGVDLFIRKLHFGHRLVLCLRDWREVTPARLADIAEIKRLATVPVVCVFPRPIPEVIGAMLAERQLVMTTIEAIAIVDRTD